MTRLLNLGNVHMNRFALERASVSPGDHLLDVGCGGGDLVARAFKNHGCEYVVGVDPSPEVIKHCRRRFRNAVNANQARFEIANVEQLPLSDSSVSQVVSSSNIYFLDNPDQAITECHRVLKSAGSMVICFNDARWLRRQKFAQHGFRFYEVDEVESLLLAKGFLDVTTEQRQDRLQGLVHCTVGKRS